MHRQRVSVFGIGLALWCLLLMSAVVGTAQEKQAEGQKKEAKAGKPGGRLPNGWTRLNPTEEQRQKIYAAQLRVRPQILALQEQIAKLQAQLRQEERAVLTPEQTAELAKIEAEDKQASGKKKADAPPKE